METEANKKTVAEETNCALFAVKKLRSIVSVKIEPGLAAEDTETVLTMEEPVRATVQVAKTLTFTTKIRIPALLKDVKDKNSVIYIDYITPNDVHHTIPSTPKKIEAEIISLDTPYCAQVTCVANKSTNVLFKYTFEVWTDHEEPDLDMTSNVIVEHGAKNI